MRNLFVAVVVALIASAHLNAQGAGPGALPLTGPGTPAGLSVAAADARFLKLDGTNDPMTGALTLPDGTAALPALNGTNDPTDGLFFTASGLGLSINGAQEYFWTGSYFIGGTGATGDGMISAAAGSAAFPTFTFSGDNTLGWYRSAAGVHGWAVGGAAELLLDATSLRPASSAGLALGTSSNSWNGGVFANPLLPVSDATIDFGSATFNWRDIYFNQSMVPKSGTMVVSGNISNVGQSYGTIITDALSATGADTAGYAANLSSATSSAGSDNATLRVSLQGAAPTAESPFASFRINTGGGGSGAGSEVGAIRHGGAATGVRYVGTFFTGGAVDFGDTSYNAHRGTAPAALPTCTTSVAGQIRYKEDTDTTGTNSQLCLCARNNGALTYAWIAIGGTLTGTCT